MGPRVPQVQPGLCLPWLCHKPDPSSDLSSMLSAEEPCPLQEWGSSLASHPTIAAPGWGLSRYKPTPPAPGSVPGGAGFGPALPPMLSYHQPQGEAVRDAGGEPGCSTPCLPASFPIFFALETCKEILGLSPLPLPLTRSDLGRPRGLGSFETD